MIDFSMNTIIGQNIYDVMIHFGFTEEELAKVLGVDLSVLCEWIGNPVDEIDCDIRVLNVIPDMLQLIAHAGSAQRADQLELVKDVVLSAEEDCQNDGLLSFYSAAMRWYYTLREADMSYWRAKDRARKNRITVLKKRVRELEEDNMPLNCLGGPNWNKISQNQNQEGDEE